MAILMSNMEPSAESISVADLLQKFVESHRPGCLSIKAGSIEWEVALQEHGYIFATHSLEPVEKLDRHLRRLGCHCPQVTPEVREAAKKQLSENLHTLSRVEAECLVIRYLLEQVCIGHSEAEELAFRLTTEALELSLLLTDFKHHFLNVQLDNFSFQWSPLDQVLQYSREHIYGWRALITPIHSPYQRPRLSEASRSLPPEQQQRLSKLLVGFSFRQLAVALNQDELKIAQNLQALIQTGVVSLLEPQSPFDQFPSFRIQALPRVIPSAAGAEVQRLQTGAIAPASSPTTSATKRIVCVDDSPTLLRIMQQYLDDNNIQIYTVADSLQALREIIRLQPDLILLDVGMPNLDGYKLCSLIRNHSLFKTTPIVMVTGNTGFLDRARARAVGATDYLTKPFNQPDLRAMVFQYLEDSSGASRSISRAV
jgi:twitching motility two-component system response regulator PilG